MDLTWPKIVLLCLYLLSLLVSIGSIGKERKPLEAGTVVIMAIITGIMSWLVIIA